MGRLGIDDGAISEWADSKRDVAVKVTTRRIFVIAIVPMLLVTGFWNWTRDQVRSEPVNTVPHQQSSSEVQMSPVGVSSFRRVSPAIVAWEERRSQAADLDAAVNTLGEAECILIRDQGVELVSVAKRRQFSEVGGKFATVVTSLQLLGTDFAFPTVVGGNEPVDGVVTGNLFVVGGGDPSVASDSLSLFFDDSLWGYTSLDVLANALAASGVTRITGDVIGDGSIFMEEQLAPGEVPTWSGLIVDDGRIFASEQNRGINSAQTAAKTMLDLLRATGITVDGTSATGNASEDLVPLAVVNSASLRTISQGLLGNNLTDPVWASTFGNLESRIAVHLGGQGFPQQGRREMVLRQNAALGTDMRSTDSGIELACHDLDALFGSLETEHPELFGDIQVGGVDATGVLVSAGADSLVAGRTSLGITFAAMGNEASIKTAIGDVFDVIDRFSVERNPLAFSPEVSLNDL